MQGLKPKQVIVLLLPLLAVLPFWYLFKGIFRMNAEMPAAFMAAGCSLFPVLIWLGASEVKAAFIPLYTLVMGALLIITVVLFPWIMIELICTFGTCDQK